MSLFVLLCPFWHLLAFIAIFWHFWKVLNLSVFFGPFWYFLAIFETFWHLLASFGTFWYFFYILFALFGTFLFIFCWGGGGEGVGEGRGPKPLFPYRLANQRRPWQNCHPMAHTHTVTDIATWRLNRPSRPIHWKSRKEKKSDL